jgi:hypothetical protein
VNGKLLKEGSSVWISDAVAEDIPVTGIISKSEE